MEIKIELGYNYKNEIKALFLEYTNMLVKNDPTIAQYLEVQNYMK